MGGGSEWWLGGGGGWWGVGVVVGGGGGSACDRCFPLQKASNPLQRASNVDIWSFVNKLLHKVSSYRWFEMSRRLFVATNGLCGLPGYLLGFVDLCDDLSAFH